MCRRALKWPVAIPEEFREFDDNWCRRALKWPVATPYEACTHQDWERVDRLVAQLSELTGPKTAFAATARACLRANGLGDFIKTPEEAVAA